MKLEFRNYLESSDVDSISYILETSDVFQDNEVDAAVKMAGQNIEWGEPDSGSYWVIVEDGKQVVGFVGYGPDPVSPESFYIRFLGVRQEKVKTGIGKLILKIAEKDIAKRGGKHIWAEIPSRSRCRVARIFFDKRGYTAVATLKDYYDEKDDKMIYVKHPEK